MPTTLQNMATPVAPDALPASDACRTLDAEGQRILDRMRTRNPKADPRAILPDVHPSRIPRHIAIIMDGNGRWANQRGFPRAFGHRNGASAVRSVIDECSKLGVEVLTLYSFSMENWKRPSDEVSGLMELYLTYLDGEIERFMAENLRFVQIGRREGLAPQVLAAADRLMEATKNNTGATLVLAVNYGARAEIVDAVRAISAKVAKGEIRPEDICDRMVSDHLYTAGLPDPDLLIRTAGEMRVSNYLLWQISYAELHVTDVLWPDFAAKDLHAAIRDYARRTRKFGGLVDTQPGAPAKG